MSRDDKKIHIKIPAKTFAALAVLLISAAAALGQTDPSATGFTFGDPADTMKRDTLVFDLDVDIDKQLLPLDSIIQIAYENSPALKVEDEYIKAKLWNYRYTRILIFQGISGFYNYSYGTQTLIVAGTTPGDNFQLSNGSRFGIAVQVPLSTFLGQGKKNKMMRAELEAARHRKDQVKQDLRRELQRVFVNMIESQRKVRIRAEDSEVAYMSFRVAEENLAQGKIDMTEFARVRNIYAISQSVLENERANFLRAFYDFETTVGVDMRFLKKPKTTKTKTPIPGE